MKNRIALALLAAFGAAASLCAAEDFAIEWGEPFSLGAGGYARGLSVRTRFERHRA